MYNEAKEIEDFNKEAKTLETKASIYQDSFAMKLVNGLGDEIKHTLNNPIKITKFQIFRFKLKNMIKRILDVL